MTQVTQRSCASYMNKLLDFIFPIRVAWRNVDKAIAVAREWERLYNDAAKTRDEALALLQTITRNR